MMFWLRFNANERKKKSFFWTSVPFCTLPLYPTIYRSRSLRIMINWPSLRWEKKCEKERNEEWREKIKFHLNTRSCFCRCQRDREMKERAENMWKIHIFFVWLAFLLYCQQSTHIFLGEHFVCMLCTIFSLWTLWCGKVWRFLRVYFHLPFSEYYFFNLDIQLSILSEWQKMMEKFYL